MLTNFYRHIYVSTSLDELILRLLYIYRIITKIFQAISRHSADYKDRHVPSLSFHGSNAIRNLWCDLSNYIAKLKTFEKNLTTKIAVLLVFLWQNTLFNIWTFKVQLKLIMRYIFQHLKLDKILEDSGYVVLMIVVKNLLRGPFLQYPAFLLCNPENRIMMTS